MTKEDFEKGIGRKLYEWENFWKIENVCFRVNDIWRDHVEFTDWYILHEGCAFSIIERYNELIKERDDIEVQIEDLMNKRNQIDKFIHIG